MRKLTFVFISFIITFSFYGQVIRTTPELNAVFTKSEIKGINTLVNYFESKILIEGKKKNECYREWFYFIMTGEEMIGRENNYNQYTLYFQNQLEVYNKIQTSLFNEIWRLDGSSNYSGVDTLRMISYSRSGKYIKYLKNLGKSRQEVQEYVHGFEMANEFSLDLRNNLFTRRTSPETSWDWEYRVDFTDFNDQVIISIISLTHNDSFYRVEKK